MLIDEVEIILRAGHGGPGKVSFNPGKKSGPNGGNGGRGGDIYISVTSDLRPLNQFSKIKTLEAENGGMGDNFQKTGRDGRDLEIKMPLGTELVDRKIVEKFELNDLNQRILICKGGLGGKGNYELRSSRRTTPSFAQKGLAGQDRDLKVELKFLAEIGLIGLPNAGKSSLLNELTSANAKTAEYPFTTLEPNLGVWERKVIADIPGLISGASEGKGLGIKFLKHIEKVGLLLHCIDATSEDVLRDYKTITAELENFNPEIIKKDEIILLTKTDLVTKEQIQKQAKILKKFKKTIIPISIHDWDSLQKLQEYLKKTLA